MLGLEFRKSIRGRTLFYIISTVALTYVLGYILPVGIDKIRHLTLGEFYFSTYTVFTQFGFLIFGFVMYISLIKITLTNVFYITIFQGII